MASQDTVTVTEELQRYYKKAREIIKPVLESTVAKDETKQSRAQTGHEESEDLFDEDADFGGDDDWMNVVESEGVPTEDNEENHRLATGTGPIEAASGILRHKISEYGSIAATKASHLPDAVRSCAETQGERLAESVGRVTVSDTLAEFVQRYPLLQRWKLAFLRGRQAGYQSQTVASPAAEEAPRTRSSDGLPEMHSSRGDGDMEDVPLGSPVDDRDEDDETEWDKME